MLPTLIHGWNFSKEIIINIHNRNKLLRVCIDLTDKCDLNCKGCFTKLERTNLKKANEDTRDFAYYESLLIEAKKLGIKAIDIVGSGEPLLDKNLFKILKYANSLDIIPTLFTSGIKLSDSIVKELNTTGSSVFIKLWSLDEKKQDDYTSRGYTNKRNKALKNLINNGFNDGKTVFIEGNQYQLTKLGADILVRKSNIDEIPDIFRFCRNHNIMPEIKTYIPVGETFEDELTAEEYILLRNCLKNIDEKEYGIEMPLTTYPQACDCYQSMASLYIMQSGNIKNCVGAETIIGFYNGESGLSHAVNNRVEKVGFGCSPRLSYYQNKNDFSKEISEIYDR